MSPPRSIAASTLYQWVSYLHEAGVRELRAPLPALRSPTAGRAHPDSVEASARPPVRGQDLDQLLSSAPWRDGSEATPRAVASQQRREPKVAASAVPPLHSGFDQPPPADRAAALQVIQQDLGECTRCKLHQGRTKIVFGVGNPEAQLMFVGEGPGRDEDLKGEPFVGRAGQKLDEMIAAIGLSRAAVYIANVVKCRPPNNRDPEPDEIETCSPFLFRQIETIRPKVIVTLGGPATKLLLHTKIGITRLRGQWQEFRGIPVMPTFHPAFVLRNYTVETRRRVWEDLKAAKARIDAG